MDFRTEWSSWILILCMMVLSYLMKPWIVESGIFPTVLQVVGLPFAAIAIACIPVLVFCYFIKKIPDIDYSIRLAFAYIVIQYILLQF